MHHGPVIQPLYLARRRTSLHRALHPACNCVLRPLLFVELKLAVSSSPVERIRAYDILNIFWVSSENLWIHNENKTLGRSLLTMEIHEIVPTILELYVAKYTTCVIVSQFHGGGEMGPGERRKKRNNNKKREIWWRLGVESEKLEKSGSCHWETDPV